LVLTYANQLTILRMVFVPCFVILLIYGYPKAATVVFLLAGITDGLDGLIARKLQQKTALGSFLDPMADKILLTAAFVTLTVPSIPPSLLGKCTTAVQLLIVGVCLLANFEIRLAILVFPLVVYSTLAFTLASGLHYSYISMKLIASYQVTGDAKKGSQNP